MPKICYVSAFLDIGRSEWKTFTRSFDNYLDSFLPYIRLFESHHNINIKGKRWCMVLYIDRIHKEQVCQKINEIYEEMPITVIPIDENFLVENMPLWGRLNRERQILESEAYRSEFPHRLMFPENSNPRYTLINHTKVDFVAHTIHHIDKTSDYFCWTDFGYFKTPNLIPHSLLNIEKFDLMRVNYTLINPLTEKDRDIFYTMHNAPECIGGFFFFGSRDTMIQYQRLYHYTHLQLQDQNIVDDDQHIALRCYYESPDLFCLHFLGRWHMAHLHFQQKHSEKCPYKDKGISRRHFCGCFKH
jgi:hypothetical protein